MADELSTKEEILLALSISMGALFLATLITLIIARYSKKIHEWCLTYLPCCKEDIEKDDINENVMKHMDSKVPLMLLGTDENQFIIPGKIFYDKIQPDVKKMRGDSLQKTRSESGGRPRGASVVTENAEEVERSRADSARKPRSGSLANYRSKSIDISPAGSLTRAFSEAIDRTRADFTGKDPRQKEFRKTSRSTDFRHSVFGISQSDQQRKVKRQASVKQRAAMQVKDMNPFMMRRNALSKSESYLASPLQVGQISPDLYRKFPGISSGTSGDDDEDHDDATVLLPARGFLSTESSPINSDDEGERTASFLDLRPELYDMSRKRSVGIGTLGKIKISLQYLDHDRTKLELFIHYMNQLQLRPSVIGIYTNVTLLPERENVYKSKMHQATEDPIFEQSFVFKKVQQADSFNTKTIRFNIYTLHGQDRSYIYGESDFSLARNEIFGQIKTDNVLNIKPPTNAVSDSIDRLITCLIDDDCLIE